MASRGRLQTHPAINRSRWATLTAYVKKAGRAVHGLRFHGRRRVRAVAAPMTRLVLAVSLLALACAACTPAGFRLSPYREDRQAAQQLARRAREACAAIRGDADLPPHPFTTDGCSMSPDGNWVECCIEHDLAYWCGGGEQARNQADMRLRRCIVAKRRSALLGSLAYATTRLGGSAQLPFPWRWGYGWNPCRGYDRDGPALDHCASWPDADDNKDHF